MLITARRTGLPEAAGSNVLSLVDRTAYDLGPDGLQFLLPFDITIAYDPDALPAGISESDLVVFQGDGAGLSPLSGSANPSAHTVSGSGTHFTDFVVGVPESGYATVPCPDLAPAASSGIPLDEVALGDLPASFDPPLVARVETDDFDPGWAFIVNDETALRSSSCPSILPRRRTEAPFA